MNKNPYYNHESKSEVEEICIYQNMESGHHSIYRLYLYIYIYIYIYLYIVRKNVFLIFI